MTEPEIKRASLRIIRSATIMGQLHKPWERLKAIDDMEAQMRAVRRHLRGEVGYQVFGPEVRRNGRIDDI